MLDGEEISDVDTVRKHTETLIQEGARADSPILVEAPPNSGKSHTAYRLTIDTESPVTYLSGREDLYEDAIKECEAHEQFREPGDIDASGSYTYAKIPSPHRTCPTFAGDNDGPTQKVKRLYQRGLTGQQIHEEYVDELPCHSPFSPCRYVKKRERLEAQGETADLLIGHHTHSYNDTYVDDRIVVLDEFNPSPFLREFSVTADNGRPSELIPDFIRQASEAEEDFPTTTVEDLTACIENRGSESARETVFEWFSEHGASREAAKASYSFFSISDYRYNQTHFSAPFLLLALFSMDQVSAGFERAPPRTDAPEVLDTWMEADVPANRIAVRNRNTGAMYLLDPPDLSSAQQVIGLDALPTIELWDLLFAPETSFDHRQVLAREDYTTYLRNALNMRIIQMGDGRYPYSGGRVSDLDETRFAAVAEREDEPFALISPQQALNTYDRQGLLDRYVQGSSSIENWNHDSSNAALNYATVRSSNEFANEPLGIVSGAPSPGDDVIQRWAALCGYAAEPTTTDNGKSYGEQADRIFQYFVHHQVVQAILRFGRDEDVWRNEGTTVYVNTTALPDWFDADGELHVVTESKTRTILNQLRVAARPQTDLLPVQTVASLADNLDHDISTEHIREVLQTYHDRGFVRVRENAGPGAADQYIWAEDDPVISISGSALVLEVTE